MEKEKKNKVIIGMILLIILIIGIIVYMIVSSGVLKKENIKQDNTKVEEKINNSNVEENNNEKNQEVIYNDFSYENYNLKLINVIKNSDKIYAVDVINLDNINYDIYVRYMDESSIKIATIETNELSIFENRSLDMENNKLYFMITSRDGGTIFELNYIDFSNLSEGAKKLDDFNAVFIEDNLWKSGVPAKDNVYPSQIFVKNYDIYYTSFKNKSLVKYNLQTKQKTTILNDIVWDDYFIDKVNNKIFYSIRTTNKLYLSDLDGKNNTELENIYNGSQFWTNAIYNGSPLFAHPVCYSNVANQCPVNLYIYDYNNNSFKKIKEDIYSNYKIKYNNIELDSGNTDDSLTSNSFFVNYK